MSKEEFIKAMQTEVEKHIPEDVTIEQHTEVKNNGTAKVGLILRSKGREIATLIYLEEFYSDYKNGVGISKLAKDLVSIYGQIKESESYNRKYDFNYKKVKDNIFFELIQKKANEELLQKVPYIEYLDLAIVFRVMIDFEEDHMKNASMLISNKNLERWKVTRDDVYEVARVNTPRILPAEIDRVAGCMYILTNCERYMGAAVILYPDMMEKARQAIEENFYILPSSIHEMILVPYREGIGREELKNMVMEINRTEVEPEDVLSDTVYYYDGKEIQMVI